ncbi:MAG TPA: hypothetical protein VI488_08415 [Candidatus Angelobacter sp.]
MRYWFIHISLLVCLTASFAGQTDSWHRYTNTNGNFSVLMPVEPQESVNGERENASASHTIQAVSGSVAYTVVYVTMNSEQKVDEVTFKVYRDAFMKGLPQCDLVTEDVASPAVQGYVGHWYRMNCRIGDKKVSFVGNLYWGKHYAYAVLTMFPTAPSDPPATRQFADSFSVIDASK